MPLPVCARAERAILTVDTTWWGLAIGYRIVGGRHLVGYSLATRLQALFDVFLFEPGSRLNRYDPSVPVYITAMKLGTNSICYWLLWFRFNDSTMAQFGCVSIPFHSTLHEIQLQTTPHFASRMHIPFDSISMSPFRFLLHSIVSIVCPLIHSIWLDDETVHQCHEPSIYSIHPSSIPSFHYDDDVLPFTTFHDHSIMIPFHRHSIPSALTPLCVTFHCIYDSIASSICPFYDVWFDKVRVQSLYSIIPEPFDQPFDSTTLSLLSQFTIHLWWFKIPLTFHSIWPLVFTTLSMNCTSEGSAGQVRCRHEWYINVSWKYFFRPFALYPLSSSINCLILHQLIVVWIYILLHLITIYIYQQLEVSVP